MNANQIESIENSNEREYEGKRLILRVLIKLNSIKIGLCEGYLENIELKMNKYMEIKNNNNNSLVAYP